MDTRHFNAYSMFALVFVFKLIFIFQGVDLTDEGYHLTQQAAAYTEKVNTTEITAAYFLTQYAGGAWLHLWSTPNLLWARLGLVLIYALNAGMIFQLLSGYFDRKKTFIAVAAAAIFITMHGYNTIIHYYTFPALLLNTWLLILSQQIKNSEKKSTIRNGFLLGFLAVPITLSRLPLMLTILLLAAVAAYCWVTKIEDPLKKTRPYMILGLLAATAAFTLFYAHIGLLDHYITDTKTTLSAAFMGSEDLGAFSETHRTDRLADIYIKELVFSIKILLTGSAVVLTLAGLQYTVGKKWMIGAMILFMFGITQIPWPTDLWSLYDPAVIIIDCVFFMLLLSSAIFLYSDRKRSSDRSLLVLCGAFILLITPLGSDTALARSVQGMWLILPLLILLAYEAKEKTANTRLKSAISVLGYLVGSIIIISILFQLINACGPDIKAEFQYPPLRGVYSTPEKVNALDEALFQIDEYTNKGDKVLMVTSIPLLYYLTETKPAFGDSWPIFRPIEKIRGDNEKMIAEGNYPKLFIYHKYETHGEPTWPNTNRTIDNPHFIDSVYVEYFKEYYIKNLGYTLLWENEAFMIYGKEKK